MHYVVPMRVGAVILPHSCDTSDISSGQWIWANPRAIVAMTRQCNTIDVTRRSQSYEDRLAEYSSRAFEVYVLSLHRFDVDPTVGFFNKYLVHGD